jgi:hypothetical protein
MSSLLSKKCFLFNSRLLLFSVYVLLFHMLYVCSSAEYKYKVTFICFHVPFKLFSNQSMYFITCCEYIY